MFNIINNNENFVKAWLLATLGTGVYVAYAFGGEGPNDSQKPVPNFEQTNAAILKELEATEELTKRYFPNM